MVIIYDGGAYFSFMMNANNLIHLTKLKKLVKRGGL